MPFNEKLDEETNSWNWMTMGMKWAKKINIVDLEPHRDIPVPVFAFHPSVGFTVVILSNSIMAFGGSRTSRCMI